MSKTFKSFQWNKVTPLSKYLAMGLFIALPFMGFVLGIKYQQRLAEFKTVSEQTRQNASIKPTEAVEDTLSEIFYIGGRTYQLIRRIIPASEKTFFILVDHISKKEFILFEESIAEAQIRAISHSEDYTKWIISRFGSSPSILIGADLSKDHSRLVPMKGRYIDFNDPYGYFSVVFAWLGNDVVMGKMCSIQEECSEHTQQYWTAPIDNLNKKSFVNF